MSDVIPELVTFGKRKSDSYDLPHATVEGGLMTWGAIIIGWGRLKHSVHT